MDRIEVFVESQCSACVAVARMLLDLTRGGGTDVRIYHRTSDPEEFKKRRVSITPATFVNEKLTFYGEFTKADLKSKVDNRRTIDKMTFKRSTSMNSQTVKRAVLAGLAGTAVMTAFALMAPMMGMPEMNIPKMLSGFMGVPVAAAWLAHFMVGTVLALFYAHIFASRLPGPEAVRGAVFGMIPWLMAQVAVNPMMGAGVFALNTPAPMLMVVGSLMGHLVYGGVLGIVYGASRLSKSVLVPQR